MKTFFKILGISILATIVYIVASAVLPFSDSFKEAGQDSNPFDMVYLWIVNLWFTLTVFYIAKHVKWSKKTLMFSLIFVYLTVYSFMTQIETIFFRNVFEVLSKLDAWIIMLANITPLCIIVPLTLKLVTKTNKEENDKIDIKLSAILKNVGVLAVTYMIVYFLFGYFIAWQFSDLRVFYSGSTKKLSFIQQMTENFNNSNIISFQLLRGVLFSIFILPIVFMLKDKSKQLLIALLLVYLSTAIVLIIPNFLFPDTVRWAHFIEMMTSMSIFSIITWIVWRNK